MPDLEQIFILFADEWELGQHPSIQDFLEKVAVTDRQEVLLELVKIDLEYRWRRTPKKLLASDSPIPAHPVLEDYARIYERLNPVINLPLALIAEEYRVRRNWGDRPSAEEYLERFNLNPLQWNTYVEQIEGENSDRLAAEHQTLLADAGEVLIKTRCPHCHNPIKIVDDAELSEIICGSCGSSINLLGSQETVTLKGDLRRTLGHFELIEQLGVGHFGAVWKARDTKLDYVVAVKIPRKGELDSTESATFFREARAAAQLRHPNIVRVHEMGRHEETVYIVSDYIEGATLHEWLIGQRLTVREAAELCVKLAGALHHAHEAGVVHRDLKPSNVMLDLNGEPHIMDFGLAKREAGEITMTMDGQILGTPAYMSPEQAKGKGHEADRRSDVYSLGVILFELLTGELPFRGETRMLIVQILKHDPPSPRTLDSRIPRDLETICLKCLEKEPERRYQSARALSNELERYLRGEPIHARPIGALGRSIRWCKRNRTISGLTTVIIFVLLAAIAAAYEIRAQTRAEGLVLRLNDAEIAQVPGIVDELSPYKHRIRSMLDERLENASNESNSEELVRIRLALLRDDPSQTSFLLEKLLTSKSSELSVLRDALSPYSSQFSESLWSVLLASVDGGDRSQVLPAAAALASYEPDSHRWSEVSQHIAKQLIAVNPTYLGEWMKALSPIRGSLTTPLLTIYRDQDGGYSETEVNNALGLLQEYAHDDLDTLSALLADSEPEQFRALFPAVAEHRSRTIQLMRNLLKETPVSEQVMSSDRSSSSPSVETAIVREFQDAHGGITDRFAFCQTMALPRVLEVMETLRGSGYRPIRLRPYRAGKSLLATAVWTRDDRLWRVECTSSKEETLEKARQLSSQNFSPIDVAGFVQSAEGKDIEQFASVWVDSDSDETSSSLCLGVLGEDVSEIQEKFARQSLLRTTTIQSYNDPDGCIRYCATFAPALVRNISFRDALFDNYSRMPKDGISDLDLCHVDQHPDHKKYERIIKQEGSESSPEDLVLRSLVYLGRTDELFERLSNRDHGFGHCIYLAFAYAQTGERAKALNEIVRLKEITQVETKARPYVFYTKGVVLAVLGDELASIKILDELAAEDSQQSKYIAARAYAAAYRLLVLQGTATAYSFAERAIELLTNIRPGYSDPTIFEHELDFHALRSVPKYADIVGSARISGVANPGENLDSIAIHGLEPTEHLLRCQELMANGYQPTSITAVSLPNQNIMTASVWNREVSQKGNDPRVAIRRANAAAALLRLGKSEEVWHLLHHHLDQSVRSLLIHRFAAVGVPIKIITGRMRTEKNDSALSALILALGEYKNVDERERQQLSKHLTKLASQHHNAEVHSAATWVMHKWRREANTEKAIDVSNKPPAPDNQRAWFVTPAGHTMVVISHRASSMRKKHNRMARSDDSRLDWLESQLSYRFAIGANEVTMAQFNRFRLKQLSKESPTSDCPASSVNWFDAAAYCRWLSEQEGISEAEMCFPKIAEIRDGMKLPIDYRRRTGYRLPTRVEWEYACRAWTTLDRFFGINEELLSKYACFESAKTHPVGTFKPNSFGIFDIYGNTREWLIERGDQVEHTRETQPHLTGIYNTDLFWNCGGCYAASSSNLESKPNWMTHAGATYAFNGFRIVRTLLDE